MQNANPMASKMMDAQKIMDAANDVVCENCGSKVFKEVVAIKKLSKFATGGDVDQIIPIPLLRCDDCGAIPNDLKPKSWKSDEPSQEDTKAES